jgi:hypothetical protein
MATIAGDGRPDSTRDKAVRIERDYYHRRSPFQRLRWMLVAAAVAVGGAWCAWGGFDPVRHHSPGPVAAVHARWESDCNACHVPFTPVKDGTWLSTPETRAAMDAKCEACHRGPVHHPLQIVAETGSCASCHVDHRGRGADLAVVADTTCVACHGDIVAHRRAVEGIPPAAEVGPITAFDAAGHPPFAALAGDPGRLRFSHAHHMLPGISFAAAGLPEPAGPRAAPPLTYADPRLSEADRTRYRPADAAADALVQLSCSSCHEFAPADGSRVLSATLTAAAPGAYALPIDFQRHCAACHADQLRLLPGSAAAVPHGLAAEPLRRAVEAAVLEESVSGTPAPPPSSPRPLPVAAGEPLVDPAAVALAAKRVAAARGLGEARCGLCHEVVPRDVPAGGAFAAGGVESGSDAWFDVPDPGIPDVWLKKARFDHRPHRAFACRECHAEAYPPPPTDPAAADPLTTALLAGALLDGKARPMIAGLESCTKCHAPAEGGTVEVFPASADAEAAATPLPRGGAGHACVECHGYHGLGPHGLPPPAVAGSPRGRP